MKGGVTVTSYVIRRDAVAAKSNRVEAIEAHQKVVNFIQDVVTMFYVASDNTEYCASIARMHNVDWLAKHLELKAVLQSVDFDIEESGDALDNKPSAVWKFFTFLLKNKKFVHFVSNMLADVGNRKTKFDPDMFLTCNREIGMDMETLDQMLLFFKAFMAFVDHEQIKSKVADIKRVMTDEMSSVLDVMHKKVKEKEKDEKKEYKKKEEKVEEEEEEEVKEKVKEKEKVKVKKAKDDDEKEDEKKNKKPDADGKPPRKPRGSKASNASSAEI